MTDPDDIDDADARPSILATLSGSATIAAGLTTLVTAVQLWSIFYLQGWRFFAWLLLLLLSVLQMGFGGRTLSGSGWATITATVITWLLELLAAAILLYALSVGLVAPLMFLWLALNGLASLLLPIAVPAALRSSANRRKLYLD